MIYDSLDSPRACGVRGGLALDEERRTGQCGRVDGRVAVADTGTRVMDGGCSTRALVSALSRRGFAVLVIAGVALVATSASALAALQVAVESSYQTNARCMLILTRSG